MSSLFLDNAIGKPEPELTGRMPSVCYRCGKTYGEQPCVPENHGLPSNGICPECYPAEAKRFGMPEAETNAPIGGAQT